MLFDVVFCNNNGIIRLRVSIDQARSDYVLAPVCSNMRIMEIGDHMMIHNHKYYIVRVG